METLSYLNSINAEYIDELRARFEKDPESVDSSWRYFFEGMGFGSALADSAPGFDAREVQLRELVSAYRESGVLVADLNPLAPPAASHPNLELSRFGLTEADLDQVFQAGAVEGLGAAPLRDILGVLKSAYCGKIGWEFFAIRNPAERKWLEQQAESLRGSASLDAQTRIFILKRLTESEGFERFLHTRYVAQKRFSVEGGESLIPALDGLMESFAQQGASDFILGMAHRGRLNVLVNVLRKKPEYIFTEFEGHFMADPSVAEGDVKYHLGYSCDSKTRSGQEIHLALASNPSHLEFVNPVVEGMVRARQTQLGDEGRSRIIPIVIHGDAALAGQGVCYETQGFSQVSGYSTGGTIHIVVNNQIGFTTDPAESRSTLFSTDLAKAGEAPVFHVNGDDPEAVWKASFLAAQYRQKFHKDVYIDIVCYRRHGHNEGDEPAFTQPLLYKKIKAHPTTRDLYAQRLVSSQIVPAEAPAAMVAEVTQAFSEAQARAKAEHFFAPHSIFEGSWKGVRYPTPEDLLAPVKTSVEESVLRGLGEKINAFPDGFQLHSKLTRFFQARAKAIQLGEGLDWGNGEALAYASLVNEGWGVRLSGQDAERGTFTHRHCVAHDFETGAKHTPLTRVRDGQGLFQVHNSPLSETGILGFEFGYSCADPRTLVIWEAQFGDFTNGAQVIVDQFIATSETKWRRMSGLVLLLPHGYEGQGPEHSSARIERFLQLCGRNNMVVANFTTPAQLFHALRRQLLRSFRKPLIVFTPKSLLRHPSAVSKLSDFSQTSFQEVLADPNSATNLEANGAQGVRKILLCSGKIYYDLLAERTARAAHSVALVRVEQLYPWPAVQLENILAPYPKSASVIWVQEEPKNMGAWNFVRSTWESDRPLRYVGRPIAASPAVGSHHIHEEQQRALVEQAFSNEWK